MTDMWADEGDSDSDFFSMSDEDWWQYQRRVLRGPDATDAPESSPVAPGPPKGLYPHGGPAIDGAASTQPLTAALEELEFTAGCEKCDEPAAYLTVIHWPGVCTHPSMDDRLLAQLVCETHLALYEARAARIVRQLNPPAFIRFFRDVKPACSSCGKAINHTGDILTIVRPI